ncbi:TMEM175 family protein [Paramicrobacterium fandaimingii]|uniref:TMEM175 family protein n=1 Tax=Paramicrobacterium fandaimingii TaxID=2708079 RepID=UPI00141F6D0D|nr:TMEM175 family protein [Microbacterium fandaimingii]
MLSADSGAHVTAEEYGVGRVEALSDGVIAVAITLLVLDLRVPEPKAGVSLADQLGDMWPNYLAYVISFLAIGIMWISHHATLRRLRAADHVVLVINLLLLLCIVALPFSTSLFATYLNASEGAHVAAVIYACSFLVTALMFVSLQYLIVVRRPHLLREPITPVQQRALLRRGALSAPVYLVAALAGLVTPYATLGICVALGFFYLLRIRA